MNNQDLSVKVFIPPHARDETWLYVTHNTDRAYRYMMDCINVYWYANIESNGNTPKITLLKPFGGDVDILVKVLEAYNEINTEDESEYAEIVSGLIPVQWQNNHSDWVKKIDAESKKD